MKPKPNVKAETADTNEEEQTKLNNEAFAEAENDIEADPELSDEPEAGDDLDEGELARFEAEK